MEEKFFEDLKKKIMPYFEKGTHGFDHTERVLHNAINISEDEDVDLDVIKVAVLLHDIARSKQRKGEVKCHAEEGSKIATEILKETDFPKEKIEKVCHAIEVHRYSKRLKPETREAIILQDADRLDAIGAICIGRVFSYGGKKGVPLYDPKIEPFKIYKSNAKTSINHFYEKILKIKPETFRTKKAREIAKERYQFIKEFIDRFLKEWNGEL